MLSSQAIAEYQKIFKKEFGEDISHEEADLQGTRLVKLFQILLQVDNRINKKDIKHKKYDR